MNRVRKLRYAGISLFGAFLLWSVANSTSPVERPFDVPVVTEGLSERLVVKEQDYDRVNIRVRGSRAALTRVSASELEYAADLSQARAGAITHVVDETRIEERHLPSGVRIVSRSPVALNFRLEPRYSRAVRVQPPAIEGAPAPGYFVAGVSVSPRRVTVTGARSEVLALRAVPTEAVEVDDASEPIVRPLRASLGSRPLWLEEGQQIEVRVDIQAREAELRAPSGGGAP